MKTLEVLGVNPYRTLKGEAGGDVDATPFRVWSGLTEK